MPVLLRPQQWGPTKPTAGVQINRDHPLAQGLACVFVLNGGGSGPTELVSGRKGSLGGAAFWKPLGLGITSASGDFATVPLVPDSPFVLPSGLTIMWRGWITGGATIQYLWGKQSNNGTTNNPFDMRTDGTPNAIVFRGTASTFNGYTATGTISNNTIPRLITITATFANNLIETPPKFYYDAKFDSQPAAGANTGAVVGNGAAIRLGRRADGGAQGSGLVNFAYAWSRPLNLNEIQWVYAEPYAFLAQPKRYFADTSGGAVATKTYTLMPDMRNRSLPVLARSRRRP